MAQVLQRVHSLDTNDTDTVKDVISAFFSQLHTSYAKDKLKWLSALEYVLAKYPRFCSSYRRNVETLLVQFLDSEPEGEVVLAARCALTLQQVRPGAGAVWAGAAAEWRRQLAALTSAAHRMLRRLYPADPLYAREDYGDGGGVGDAGKAGEVGSGGDGEGELRAALRRLRPSHTALRNLLLFTQAMLVERYPVAKGVDARALLELVVRAGSAAATPDARHATLPECARLQHAALRTLHALLLCLGANLLPYWALVLRLCTQALTWAHSQPSEHAREVLVSAYGAVAAAVRAGGGGACGGAHMERIVRAVLADTAPSQHDRGAQLQTNMAVASSHAGSKKNMSRKARRRQALGALAGAGAGAVEGATKVDEEVAAAAYCCLETLLLTCARELAPHTMQAVCEHLVRVCAGGGAGGAEAGPGAWRALEAARLAAPTAPARLAHIALHLYSHHTSGVGGGARAGAGAAEAWSVRARALLAVRQALHAAPPPLPPALAPPPAPAAPVVPTPAHKRAHSQNNMAALATLLGNKRVREITANGGEDRGGENGEADGEAQITLSSDDEPDVMEVEQVDLEEQEQPAAPALSNGNGTRSSIHDLATQAPAPRSPHATSTIDVDQDSDTSIEITYDDHPDSGSQVFRIAKMPEDNLPSTDETDDVITCAQVPIGSQESDNARKKENEGLIDSTAEPVEDISDHLTQELACNTTSVDSPANDAGKDNLKVVDNNDEINKDQNEEKTTSKNDSTEELVNKEMSNDDSLEVKLASFVDEVGEDKLKNFKCSDDSSTCFVVDRVGVNDGKEKTVEEMLGEFD